MPQARFGAILAIMLVLGIAGVAWGSDGDPMILGQDNNATLPTSLDGNMQVTGQVYVRGPLLSGDIQGELHPWCSGTITIPAGHRSWRSGFTGGDCNGLGLFATLNGVPPRGIWVVGARNVHPQDQPWVVIYLNRKTPVPVSVVFVGIRANVHFP